MIKSPSDRYVVLYNWGVSNTPDVAINSAEEVVVSEQGLKAFPDRDQAIPIELVQMSVDMLAAILGTHDVSPASLQLLSTVREKLTKLFPG